MEIICRKCRARLNIPDEKIPRGKQLTISCPKCKKRLVLEGPAAKEEEIQTPEYGQEEQAKYAREGSDSASWEDDTLDLYEEGMNLALVLMNHGDGFKKISKAVEELDYVCVPAQTTRKAIGLMRLHHFEIVILWDKFDGNPLSKSPILQYLNHLSMSIRRKIFLVLIGSDFKTLDHMMAFAMSANLVVNENDLDKLVTVLKRAISDHERFYKVFADTLAEVGKI